MKTRKHKRPAGRQRRLGHRINMTPRKVESPPPAATTPAPVTTAPPPPPPPPPISEEEANGRAWDQIRARFSRADLRLAAHILANGGEDLPWSVSEPADMLQAIAAARGDREARAWPLLALADKVDQHLCQIDRASQDAARAIAAFIPALRWAEARPDRVRALVVEIGLNHQLWHTAAWPRLAYIIAAYGREALAPYPTETEWLLQAARYELGGHPEIVPEAVYRMLGIRGIDPALARVAAEDLAAARRDLEIAAARAAELLFVAGAEKGAPR